MYKITIIKEEVVETTEESYERIADSGNERDRGAVYAYVPHTTHKERETVIYTQRIDDINLVAVINAANFVNTRQDEQFKADKA